MDSVSFRMAGSGSWQNLLQDETSRQLYAQIYPTGKPLANFDSHLQELLTSWQQASIVKLDNDKIVPSSPIMTDEDMNILSQWFQDISNSMSTAVWERLPEYRSLASSLAEKMSPLYQDVDNILTILICAQTLDSWVFALLRRELIGTYPPRDLAGDFFFWAYAFSNGPKRIFGFTSYIIWERTKLHVIRSHGLDRNRIKALLKEPDVLDYIHNLSCKEYTSREYLYTDPVSAKKCVVSLRDAEILERDNPLCLSIPVFTDRDMIPAIELYQSVSGKIISHITNSMDGLKGLIGNCSFKQCFLPDIICMLFHLAYSYAADELVNRGTIPDFPQIAGGEWGVWIHNS